MKYSPKIIGLKVLRENMGEYAVKVAQGESFIVVKQSKPLFKIGPIDEEESYETLIDFTKIKKGGVPIDEVLEALRIRNKKHGQTSKNAR